MRPANLRRVPPRTRESDGRDRRVAAPGAGVDLGQRIGAGADRLRAATDPCRDRALPGVPGLPLPTVVASARGDLHDHQLDWPDRGPRRRRTRLALRIGERRSSGCLERRQHRIDERHATPVESNPFALDGSAVRARDRSKHVCTLPEPRHDRSRRSTLAAGRLRNERSRESAIRGESGRGSSTHAQDRLRDALERRYQRSRRRHQSRGHDRVPSTRIRDTRRFVRAHSESNASLLRGAERKRRDGSLRDAGRFPRSTR